MSAAAAGQLDGRTNVEDIANGAFSNHQVRLILHNQNAQSLAQGVIRHLIDLVITGEIKLAVGANRFVNWVRKASFIKRIQVGVEKSFLVRAALCVQRSLELYGSLRKVPVLSAHKTFMLPRFSSKPVA